MSPGVLAALAYCLVSGYQVPAQRTVLMLAVAALVAGALLVLPLVVASWAVVLSSSGSSACMRSGVKRTVGPAIVTTPKAGWPAKRTGADIALRPAV